MNEPAPLPPIRRDQGSLAPFVLVGFLPPPPTGQSLAFELLVRALEARGLPFEVVNLTGRDQTRLNTVTVSRMVDYALIFFRLLRVLSRRPLRGLYLSISSSRQGVLRDGVIVLLARLRRLRVVGHAHTGNYHLFYASQPPVIRRLARAVWRRLDTLVILSERLRDSFSFAPELSPKITIVHNPAAVESPPANKVLAKAPPNPDCLPVRLLFLSNLVKAKGYLDAVEATRLLRDQYQLPVHLVLAGAFLRDPGDPEDHGTREQAENELRWLIEVNELSECVRYCGIVEGACKESLLDSAHFLLLPSYYSLEGQPLAVVEALAWGVVPITTAHRAIPDLVKDGINGIHVPPGNPATIAREIARIAKDPTQYRRLSRAAVQHYHTTCSVERHLTTMFDVLDYPLEAKKGVLGKTRHS